MLLQTFEMLLTADYNAYRISYHLAYRRWLLPCLFMKVSVDEAFTELTLQLQENVNTLALWNHKFTLQYKVVSHRGTLELT